MTYDAAWCDFDRDGDLDIFVSNHAQPPSLYRNNGDGTFTDIFPASGMDTTRWRDRHGGAWGDVNNDGLPDLYIAHGADRGKGRGKNELYLNLGGGKFRNIASQIGVSNPPGRGRDPTWIDLDRDGYLDLYVGNLSTPNPLFLNSRSLAQPFRDIAPGLGISKKSRSCNAWCDFDRDGDDDLFLGGESNGLYLNLGKTGFKETAARCGIKRLPGATAIAWGDYNNDGYPDLFISRGHYQEAWRWEGGRIEFSAYGSRKDYDGIDFTAETGKITFRLRHDWGADHKLVRIGSGMIHPARMPFSFMSDSKTAAGRPDFIPGKTRGFSIWRDPGTRNWHIRWTGDSRGGHDYDGIIESTRPFSQAVAVDFSRPRLDQNTLYKNTGTGRFVDVTAAAGLTVKGIFQAAAWGDYDNDGDLDRYLVNCGDGLHNGPNYLFQNRGDGTFVDVAREAGAQANVGGRGMGAAWGDCDNDGFLDLFLTNGFGPPLFSSGPHLLLRNSGNGNNWLKVLLRGTKSNRLGLGAQVTLKIGKRVQYREAGSNSELYSQGYRPLHFGLGRAKRVDSLEIKWPGGRRQFLANIPVNQLLRVVED